MDFLNAVELFAQNPTVQLLNLIFLTQPASRIVFVTWDWTHESLFSRDAYKGLLFTIGHSL